MRVVGLDGREYVLRTSRGREGRAGASGPHERARGVLRRAHPLSPILEEVPLPGTGGLTADFFLPHTRLLVEVHGQQHFRYTPHFHGTRAGFLASLRNDRRKAEWCSLNGVRLIVLRDTEGDGEWEERIGGGGGGGEAGGDGGGD